MSAQRNESSPYGQSINSYDPLIWRKDVQVISNSFPHNIFWASRNIEKENSEKIVKSFLNDKGMFI